MYTYCDESDCEFCDTCSTRSTSSILSVDTINDKFYHKPLDKKSVHFDEQVEVFQMPSRYDIAHLFSDLYYGQKEIRRFKDDRYDEVRIHVIKHKCSVRQAMCDLYQIDQEEEQVLAINNLSINAQLLDNVDKPTTFVDYEKEVLQLRNDF